MGNSCQKTSTVIPNRKVASSPQTRDYQPSVVMKKEELDHAVAKEETTSSYENITKVYNWKKEIGKKIQYSQLKLFSRPWKLWNCSLGFTC